MTPNTTESRASCDALPSKIEELVNRYRYTRFVTLQLNDPHHVLLSHPVALDKMRQRLRRWDAHMNRRILGKYWSSSPERMFSFFFPEKTQFSPHWHGVIRFFTDDPVWRAKMEARFDREAERCWFEVALGGTCDVQPISDQEIVTKYIAKSLAYGVSFENFVVPDEFAPR